jgi:hypothetical protein
MTSEIAILNSNGIALAADSAVTIGNQKVYNSANKLFTLSKYHPVGVMIYDSGSLIDVHWETIIKEYRSKLGKKSFVNLKEYADDFWRFISEDKKVITNQKRDEYVYAQAVTYMNMLYEQLEQRVKNQIESEGETTLEKSYKIFITILAESGKIMASYKLIDGVDDLESKKILDKHKSKFEEISSKIFGELFPLFNEDDKNILYTQVSKIFIKNYFFLNTSGVVVAGFGVNDVYPRIASYIVEGVVGDFVKKIFNEGKSNIQHDYFVTTIVPFAQDEMVWTFMSGMDPDLSKFAMKYLEDIFNKYPLNLSEAEFGVDATVMNKIKDKIIKDGIELLNVFNNDLYKFQRENNSQPILDMVGVLPKDELAAMAESLVNLTVFKRKVSKAMETVGGPVDVAVISKGDGFIWVKRKHYFEPELNHNFFANYFKEV